MSDNFYIGSCRYQYLFNKYFPPRLHTTKEIINFLNNYKNIDLYVQDILYIYGDSIHCSVINETQQFLNNPHILFNNNKFFLEISSKKYFRNINNNQIYNYFVVNIMNRNKEDLELIIQDENEINEDIKIINELIINNFNCKQIYIISHINLPLKESNTFISTRNELVVILNKVCKNYNIKFIDIGKKILKLDYKIYMEDVSSDSIHYNNNFYSNIIKKYL